MNLLAASGRPLARSRSTWHRHKNFSSRPRELRRGRRRRGPDLRLISRLLLLRRLRRINLWPVIAAMLTGAFVTMLTTAVKVRAVDNTLANFDEAAVAAVVIALGVLGRDRARLVVFLVVPAIWRSYRDALAAMAQPGSEHLARILADESGLYKRVAKRTGQPLPKQRA